MTSNLHRRLEAVEAAEQAKRLASPELIDMSAYSDDELRFLEEYARRLIDGEQPDWVKFTAE